MSQTYGKTSWKRFAVVMVPTVAATAAVGISMAQGALAASFAVSGVHATISADSLVGDGFTQYGSIDKVANGNGTTDTAVAVSGFTKANITNLCQSVVVPVLGGVTLKIEGGTDPNNPVVAKHILLDMTDLKAKTATFTNINIGVANSAVSKGPIDPAAQQGAAGVGFAQEADHAELTNVLQASYATQADSFSLTDMHLSLAGGDHSCVQKK